VSANLRWSLLVAGEAALVLFLLTFGNTFTGSVPLHRTHLAILGLLGLFGWLAILTRPSRLSPLLVVAPLPLLAAITATSILSPYPSLSWYATCQCAGYIGIAWLLAIQAGHPVGRRNLIAAMGIVVALVTAVYLVEVALAWAEWLSFGFPLVSLPLRPLGTGGVVQIPTWVPDVIALCAPVVAVSLWVARARALAVGLAAAGSVAILISGTRSVLLLIVVVVVVGAIFAVRSRGSRMVAIVATATAIAVIVVGLSVVVLTARSLDAGRSSLWASAIDGFLSAPIAGTGPGTYAVNRTNDTVDVLSRLVHPDANNSMLTIASESGLIGLAGLGLAVAAYVVAVRRAWRVDPEDRPIVAASVLGLAIVAGHAMVDVAFALIGVLLLVLACLALASTSRVSVQSIPRPRPRRLTAVLVAGLIVIAIASIGLWRSELTLGDVVEADAALPESPQAALAAARAATQRSPESAPGWWIRMVAADATGDAVDAIASARRIADLEGFGQEWISIATLLGRSGDAVGAREAFGRATAHPPLDPIVQLNAAIGYHAAGDTADAEMAVRGLFAVRPDIEPSLAQGPPGLAATAARIRPAAATALITEGDADSAMLVALSGEDRDLATALLAEAGFTAAGENYWKTIIAAWFGDQAARLAHEAASTADPNPDAIDWSWRLAARACDERAISRWKRAMEISAGRQPAAPIALGVAPGFQVRMFPARYPGVVWRMDHPERPYVEGIWTYALGVPGCPSTTG
jgi:O-antigen ligase